MCMLQTEKTACNLVLSNEDNSGLASSWSDDYDAERVSSSSDYSFFRTAKLSLWSPRSILLDPKSIPPDIKFIFPASSLASQRAIWSWVIFLVKFIFLEVKFIFTEVKTMFMGVQSRGPFHLSSIKSSFPEVKFILLEAITGQKSFCKGYRRQVDNQILI
ncbi:hypothetical protein ARMGADRAFT_1031471 [Armillaria gallica]|uniref:Uncharacterized protein n=1 Tax=Armillaria gallica TaxID=47427 RepID=A0A2H3D9U4_ARMGA|nr:hypothetical protein ARMGADRAFT_1031471 [Armillaria gallica]